MCPGTEFTSNIKHSLWQHNTEPGAGKSQPRVLSWDWTLSSVPGQAGDPYSQQAFVAGAGRSVWEGITMMQFVTARSAVHVWKPTETTLAQMAWISWSLLLQMLTLLLQNCSSLCTNIQQPQGLASREKLSSSISSCIRSLTRYHIPVPALKCSKGDNLNAGGAGWNSHLCSVGKEEFLCSSLAP